MSIDTKTSKVLTQAYFIVTLSFISFAMGLGISLYVNNLFLSIVVGITTLILSIVFYFSQTPKQKAYILFCLALLTGYLGGSYCSHYGLETKEIMLVSLMTVGIFVSSTIAALVSRELMVMYAIMAGLIGLAYIPITIYYLFTWGFTTFYLLLSLGLVMSVFGLILDTQKIILRIEQGYNDPFTIAFILFEDAYDIFINLVRLFASSKESKKNKNKD